MIFFSLFMMWAFPWKEYEVQSGQHHTSVWRPLWDSINFCTPFLTLSLSNPHILTYLVPQGTSSLKFALTLAISQVVSQAGAHPRAPNRTLGRLSALRVTPQYWPHARAMMTMLEWFLTKAHRRLHEESATRCLCVGTVNWLVVLIYLLSRTVLLIMCRLC